MPESQECKQYLLYDILIYDSGRVPDGSVVFTADSLGRAQKLVREWSDRRRWIRYSIRELLLTEVSCCPTGHAWHYDHNGIMKKWR